MNTYADKWGIEAYSVDENADVLRVYFIGNRWSKVKADMFEFTEAESLILKAAFEIQGLNITMHKMHNNNPPLHSPSTMPIRNSRAYWEAKL